MARALKCDNSECQKIMDPDVDRHYTVQLEIPTGFTMKDDIVEKQFCTIECLAKWSEGKVTR